MKRNQTRTTITYHQLILIISLIVLRLYFAIYGIISDCDETFNYWEPLNLLIRGFGKQTWEYSPEFGIRSWSFLLPFAYFGRLIPQSSSEEHPAQLFYIFRIIRALFTTIAEISMAMAIDNQSVRSWYLLFAQISPGMSHASISLLPSSFAMDCISLMTASIINHYKKKSTSGLVHAFWAVFWISVGGLSGWPFVLVLIVPFVLHTLLTSCLSDYKYAIKFIIGSAIIFITLLITITAIDSIYYNKLTIVPLNAVLYNVFNKDDTTGPNIFGVEPVSYYVLNLLLNFNILAPLAYVGTIFIPLVNTLIDPIDESAVFGDNKRLTILISPLIIWTLIFFAQPHKEERFLYPIYPFILLVSAITMTQCLELVNKFIIANVVRYKKLQKLFSSLMIGIVGALITMVSISRCLSLVENYSAPLRVYDQIPRSVPGSGPGSGQDSENVCVGREWYHFPASFFLHDDQRLRFIKSGFNGILPGDFPEEVDLLSAIATIPTSMNNKNLFEADKVVEYDVCDYYIDIDKAVDDEAGELQVFSAGPGLGPVSGSGSVNTHKDWDLIYCDKFIDIDNSHGLIRLLYIPQWIQSKFKTIFGVNSLGHVEYFNYCIAQKKKRKNDLDY